MRSRSKMKVMSVQNGVRNNNISPCFSGNREEKTKIISPFEVIVLGAFSAVCIHKALHPASKVFNEYAKNLASELSKIKKQKINPYSLSCIMDKQEFFHRTLRLSPRKYINTPENIETYAFQADLYMKTKYSDGKVSVANLLDQISEYSNKLFKRTGKKFIFAITDQDSVKSVKEAIEIIAKNPKKFRNVRFIPAVELSCAHPAQTTKNPCEVSNLIAYGINPYKIDKYLDALQQKRNSVLNNMFEEIQKQLPLTKFNKEEFFKNYGINKDCLPPNLHWAVNNYAQTKHAVTIQAARHKQDAAKLYENLIMDLDAKNKNIWYLKNKNVLDNDIDETEIISNVRKKYEPHLQNNKVTAPDESSFEDLVNLFNGEAEVSLAFANPYLTASYFNQPEKSIKAFANNSKDLIQLTLSYNKGFTEVQDPKFVEKIDKALLSLINIGGTDNKLTNYIEVYL